MNIDRFVFQFLQSLHTPGLNAFFADVTALASIPVLLIVFFAFLGGRLGRHGVSELVIAAALLTAALAGLKAVTHRARPLLDPAQQVIAEPQSGSFPSGHAAWSMFLYVTLAASLADPGARRYALAWAIALSLLIGLSRLYLGVHWLTDVIVGWGLGAIVAALLVRASPGPT